MPENQTNNGLEKLKEFFKEKGLTQEMIAEQLGISQSLVNQYLNGKKPFGKKTAKRWADKFGLSPSWLLIREGKMIDKYRIDEIVSNTLSEALGANYGLTKMKTYPLIPIEAVAGYGADENGVTYEDCDQYAVPDFEAKGMEFLIRVSGSSMFPKYNNGDILACRKIADVLFFQWGRVYVIDSSQGQLVKRIYEDRENPDNIVCKSDNEEKYPPFSIPKNDIRSLSLVVGAIKLD